MPASTSQIAFEQPLNERVRTFLRLQFLFNEAQHHLQDGTQWGQAAGVRTVLEILSILGRSDQRTEVLKELEMQQGTLSALHNRPGVDNSRLTPILERIRKASADVAAVPPNAALFVRDHDFLTSVVNRSAIPGGTCSFDLPGYHRWLSQPLERQKQDLDYWYRCIAPFEQAIHLLIELIRESSAPKEYCAQDGVYVHVIEQPAQMVRVFLPAGTPLYPEISAGKHRCTIRFMQQEDVNRRPEQIHEAVNFRFALCCL